MVRGVSGSFFSAQVKVGIGGSSGGTINSISPTVVGVNTNPQMGGTMAADHTSTRPSVSFSHTVADVLSGCDS